MEQRTWHHTETPLAVPSAAAYRTGCRCDECRTANIQYMRLYHRRLVILESNTDGTTTYHVHRGTPSTTTAMRWGCIHPRCLYLAGLYLDGEDVRHKNNNTIAEGFGTPAPA